MLGGRTPKILVVDDQPLYQGMIAGALRQHGLLVATASTPDEARTTVARHGVDLMCMDVELLADITGFELAHELRALRPDTPIVFVSVLADPQYLHATDLPDFDQYSYVRKSSIRQIDELVTIIEDALAGRFYVDPDVVGTANGRQLGLTAHQVRMLRMAARGRSNAAIAEELGVSVSSVETSFSRIARSLNVERDQSINVRVACVRAYLQHVYRG